MADAKSKGRLSAGESHSKTLRGKIGNAKLDKTKVELLREICPTQISFEQAALLCGVVPSAISKAVSGETWSWIK